jgi:glycosyltransferase involved in cell wall biosynthesis
LKVCLLSTSDIEGGAARAAYRLHQGLRDAGLESTMLVQTQSSDNPYIDAPTKKLEKGIGSLRPTFDRLPMYLTGQGNSSLSPAWLPDQKAAYINRHEYDLVHLHWINKGFLRLETLSNLKRPLVWTLHDMWPFTGGCHYNFGCERYRVQCGLCPQLTKRSEFDLSHQIWERKQKAWQHTELTVICPSDWMAECAMRSSLFSGRRIEVIANGLDTQQFKPFDRQFTRDKLRLPQDKHLILFSATKAIQNPFKGFNLLQECTFSLAKMGWKEKATVMVLGASQGPNTMELGLPTVYLGILQDEISLSLVYAAADVFVAPSLQDNLPNTVMESLACGTPCAAFDIGGIPDMVTHQINGYLAKPGDPSDLAFGIDWILRDKNRWQHLANEARSISLEKFNIKTQVQKYLDIYQDVIDKNG